MELINNVVKWLAEAQQVIVTYWYQFGETLTVADVVVLSTIALYALWRAIKLLLDKKTAQTAELVKKNLLEAKSKVEEKVKAERHGLVAFWQFPSPEESQYMLDIYNDGDSTIFNAELSAPEKYQRVCIVSCPKKILKANGSMSAFVLPDRRIFPKIWKKSDFRPIIFKLRYTKTPQAREFTVVEVPFELSNTHQHFQDLIAKMREEK